MTKKDFELIASILKSLNFHIESITKKESEKISELFSIVISQKYSKFQKDKFLIACGIKEEEHKHNTSYALKDCNACIGFRKEIKEEGFCYTCGELTEYFAIINKKKVYYCDYCEN